MPIEYFFGCVLPLLVLAAVYILQRSKTFDRLGDKYFPSLSSDRKVKLSHHRPRARSLLTALRIRDKAEAVREARSWSIGDYGGMGDIDLEKAADLVTLGIVDTDLWRLVQQEDRLILQSCGKSNTESRRTILRVGEGEFLLHTYFDTGGN